jgi:hypothetical protein
MSSRSSIADTPLASADGQSPLERNRKARMITLPYVPPNECADCGSDKRWRNIRERYHPPRLLLIPPLAHRLRGFGYAARALAHYSRQF